MRAAISLFFATLFFLFACATATVSIDKTLWVHCWDLCGKADRLESVTADSCICKGGYRMSQKPIEVPKEAEPFSLFEFLGFTKGD